MQADGKILVAGSGTTDFTVTRFNADGTVDDSYGTNGTASIGFNGGADHITSMALQSDGKLLVAGDSQFKRNPSDDGYDDGGGIARLTDSGAPDPTFAGDGKTQTPGSVSDGSVRALAVTPDGLIYSARSDDVQRYTADGIRDATFSAAAGVPLPLLPDAMAFDALGRLVVVGTDGGDFAVARLSAAGAPDLSWSGDGLQTTDFGPNSVAHDLAFTTEGNVVVGGDAGNSSSGEDFAVARYTPTGDPDPAFSIDGLDTQDIAGGDTLAGIAVETDGTVVAIGSTGVGVMSPDDIAIVRWTALGALDGTWAGDGTLELDFAGGDDSAAAVALTGTKVLAVGSSRAGAPEDYALARYDDLGAPDPTFSDDGKTTAEAGETFDQARDVAVQSDGKTVVVGNAYNGDSDGGRFGVARYDVNGSLDPSFDGDGITTTSISFSEPDSAEAVAIQPDGGIVVAGWSNGVLNGDLALVRYLSDGSLDPSFSGDGKVATDIGAVSGQVYGVAIAGDKIVVAGRAGQDFLVARYLHDGTPDPSFSGDGRQIVEISTSTDYASAVAVQGDGKVLAAGMSRPTVNDPYDFAVVRLDTAGELDPSFSGDGKQTTDMGGSDTARDMVLDADQRIILAGDGGDALQVARYDTAGELDPSWSGDGKQSTDVAEDDFGYGVALQADGKVLVGGYAVVVDHQEMVLARYTTGGELDSFGTGGVAKALTGDADFGLGLAVGPGETAVMVGGSFSIRTYSWDFSVVRFVTTGGGTGPTPVAPVPNPPATPPPAVQPPPVISRPSLSAVPKKLRPNKKGKLSIRVRCLPAGAPCAGSVRILVKGKPVARKAFRKAGKVTLKLNKKTRKLLRKKNVNATVKVVIGTRTASVKLKLVKQKPQAEARGREQVGDTRI